MNQNDTNNGKENISVQASFYYPSGGSAVIYNFRVAPGETVIEAFKKHHRKYVKFNPTFSLIKK